MTETTTTKNVSHNVPDVGKIPASTSTAASTNTDDAVAIAAVGNSMNNSVKSNVNTSIVSNNNEAQQPRQQRHSSASSIRSVNKNTKDLITLYYKDQQRQKNSITYGSTDDRHDMTLDDDTSKNNSSNNTSKMVAFAPEKDPPTIHDALSSHDYDDTERTNFGSEESAINDEDDIEEVIESNRCHLICCRKSKEGCLIKRSSLLRIPTIRELALLLSLYINLLITITKLITYIRTLSLSVLASLLDSVLDVVSQLVLNYTERHSSLQRSSAFYPAGASRLEPIGVLTCAALMGMASFEVLKQSLVQIFTSNTNNNLNDNDTIDIHDTKTMMKSFISMFAIVIIKLLLLWICKVGAHKHEPIIMRTMNASSSHDHPDIDEHDDIEQHQTSRTASSTTTFNKDNTTTLQQHIQHIEHENSIREKEPLLIHHSVLHNSYRPTDDTGSNTTPTTTPTISSPMTSNRREDGSMMTSVDGDDHHSNMMMMMPNTKTGTTKTTITNSNEVDGPNDDGNDMDGDNPMMMMTSIVSSDPTLEALAQDHLNDCLSNTVAGIALFLIWYTNNRLWYLDPIGAILISLYIIYSWYITGKEQIEQLTGKSAPDDFIDELRELATNFDPNQRIVVDVIRAYHFGPKFLVEIEIVMPKSTYLYESHDLGMELQYEIESLSNVERCFVHIDYETRPYDEHVVSKVPELLEKYRPTSNGTGSLTGSAGSGSHTNRADYRSTVSV